MPNSGRVVKKIGSATQCTAQSSEAPILIKSNFDLKPVVFAIIINWPAKLIKCNNVAKNIILPQFFSTDGSLGHPLTFAAKFAGISLVYFCRRFIVLEIK